MCRKTLEEGLNEGFYTPPSLQGSVMYPSNGGGNNWGQLREDGRQFVVVAAGGHWSALSPPGDYIVAYALPVAD